MPSQSLSAMNLFICYQYLFAMQLPFSLVISFTLQNSHGLKFCNFCPCSPQQSMKLVLQIKIQKYEHFKFSFLLDRAQLKRAWKIDFIGHSIYRKQETRTNRMVGCHFSSQRVTHQIRHPMEEKAPLLLLRSPKVQGDMTLRKTGS